MAEVVGGEVGQVGHEQGATIEADEGLKIGKQGSIRFFETFTFKKSP